MNRELFERPAIVRPAADLAALAAAANAAHDGVEAADRNRLANALKAGEALARAKAQCAKECRAWSAWVEDNLRFSCRTADTYINVYKHRRKFGTVPNLGLSQAEKLAEEAEREEAGVAAKEAAGPVPAVIQGERWRVEAADCLDWLNRQPADSVDLCLFSPPYQKARLYLEHGKDLGIVRDTEEEVAWLVRVIEACLRVCKGSIFCVYDGQTRDFRYSGAPVLLWADLIRRGICTRKAPIYQRSGIPGSGGPDGLRNDYEFVLWVTRGGKLPWSDNTACGHPPKGAPGGENDPWGKRGRGNGLSGRNRDGTRKRGNGHAARGHKNGDATAGKRYDPPLANPGNVICCNVASNLGNKLAHENEAPFAESLAEFLIKSYCPPGGIVADPFCGSGTTLAVAVRRGRIGWGCDIRPSQVQLTQRRLAGVTPAP
jgi:hypothetical protein